MTTIGDKFAQLGTSIINLVGTRASKNMDNLTSTGEANIVEIVENAGISGGSGHSIGEVVYSAIPMNDACFHLLDGSLIYGDGVYNDFVTYMSTLYAADPTANYWTTESDWQSSVTTYGVCGKFVYDSENRTVRLPKVTGIIEGTTDASALGDLVEAGLPNITGNAGIDSAGDYSGPFYSRGSLARGTGTNNYASYAGFDLSRANSIYGNSNTVQPQTIKAFYYIVIANSTKTEIQSDIDEITTDLNGKADTDLTNITDTGYIKMAGAGMPSNTYVDLTLGASGSSYTAPADGYIFVSKFSTGTQYFNLQTGGSTDGTVKIQESKHTTSNNVLLTCTIPVTKGETFYTVYNANGATIRFRFYYAVGSESEAN